MYLVFCFHLLCGKRHVYMPKLNIMPRKTCERATLRLWVYLDVMGCHCKDLYHPRYRNMQWTRQSNTLRNDDTLLQIRTDTVAIDS